MKKRTIHSRASVLLDSLENRRLMAIDPFNSLWTAPVDGGAPTYLAYISMVYSRFQPFGGELYIQSSFSILKTDGTVQGTEVAVKGLDASDSRTLVGTANGYLYYSKSVYNSNLHKNVISLHAIDVNGIEQNVPAPATYDPVPDIVNSLAVGNAQFYAFDDGTHGNEIWLDDGNGAQLLQDLQPGANPSNPNALFQVGDTVVFRANAPYQIPQFGHIDNGVLKIDGTAAKDRLSLKSSGGVTTLTISNATYFQLENTFNDADFTSIVIAGGAQDDGIDLSGTTKPASILGGDGDDWITTGSGNSSIDGGAGHDTLDYSAQTQSLTSGYPALINVGNKTDSYQSVETLMCGSGDDNIYSYSYVSSLRVIYGNGGDDVLSIVGDEQDHSIVPSVHGGAGNDTITINRDAGNVSGGDAYYFGDDGNDLFLMDRVRTNRFFHGGNGLDTVDYRYMNNVGGIKVTFDDVQNDGPYGNDNVYQDVEGINGTPDNDTLIGTDRSEKLFGNNGGDYIIGGGGHDTIDGGDGNNAILNGPAIDYSSYYPRLHGTNGNDLIVLQHVQYHPELVDVVCCGIHQQFAISNIKGFVIDGADGNDRIDTRGFSIPATIYGHGGDDQILGGDGADRIYGGDGNDWISGGDGKDVIYGDAGNDRLFGGNGKDYIVGGTGVDVIRGEGDRDSIFAKKGDDYSGNKGDLITLLA